MYLASKIEECGVISSRHLHREMGQLLGTTFGFLANSYQLQYEPSSIAECELQLLEQLSCYLIVYQPYRSLLALAASLDLPDCLPLAWYICNDSYRTSACLIYPPHIIALAALHLACIARDDVAAEVGRRASPWPAARHCARR